MMAAERLARHKADYKEAVLPGASTADTPRSSRGDDVVVQSLVGGAWASAARQRQSWQAPQRLRASGISRRPTSSEDCLQGGCC